MEQHGTSVWRSDPGAAFYTKRILSIYDIGVLGLSNAYVWKCPTREILRFYNRHVSTRHLDVGVGTGYFPDHCAFPIPAPALTLMDLNPNSLQAAARRLRRYRPATILDDAAMAARPATAPFDSIAITYFLHCLPGTMADKGRVFAHLADWLAPGGVIFGTTILGAGVPHGGLADRFLRFYNRRRVFSNGQDTLEGLIDMLRAHCRTGAVRTVGSVAFFEGHR